MEARPNLEGETLPKLPRELGPCLEDHWVRAVPPANDFFRGLANGNGNVRNKKNDAEKPEISEFSKKNFCKSFLFTDSILITLFYLLVGF